MSALNTGSEEYERAVERAEKVQRVDVGALFLFCLCGREREVGEDSCEICKNGGEHGIRC